MSVDDGSSLETDMRIMSINDDEFPESSTLNGSPEQSNIDESPIECNMRLGIVVEIGDERATIIIYKYGSVIDLDKLPSDIKIGEWIRFTVTEDDHEILFGERGGDNPLEVEIEDGHVKVCTIIAIPGRNGSTYGLMNKKISGKNKVWSPYLDWAMADDKLLINVAGDVPYEAFYQYSGDLSNPWILSQVITMVQDETTWWKYLENSPWIRSLYQYHQSHKGPSDFNKEIVDDFYTEGMIIALIDRPDPKAIAFSRFDGAVELVLRDWMCLGDVVSFVINKDGMCHDVHCMKKRKSGVIIDEATVEDGRVADLSVMITIDDGLLIGKKEGSIMYRDLHSDRFGIIRMKDEEWLEVTKEERMELSDLIKAKEDGEKLHIVIRYDHIYNSWKFLRINPIWFAKEDSESIVVVKRPRMKKIVVSAFL